MQESYTIPDVWPHDEQAGTSDAGNRSTAGPRKNCQLPVGTNPFQLYSLGTPNGQKVTILFEELLASGQSEAEYDAWMISIGKGDQFGSGFVEINPNSKIPALVDRSGATPYRIFESGSILLHLASRFKTFLPVEEQDRAECLSWLFWQVGSAPYLGGGFGHFFHYAASPMEYPINRFTMETKRQLDVLDQQLRERPFIAGDYSIADIAIWPWYGRLVLDQLYPNAARFLAADRYRNLIRWAETIAERDAVKRGLLVNNSDNGIVERHSPADIDAILGGIDT
ncbi:glutathione-dependent disulfide-bond oxidoreductase [Sphingobium sp. Cam5-1]|uniref:glutathione-dependent disulfide-bond oxidoreductase n=1 Tax=Sphingobium sp. Cam5-1 TaxID=2789327 RepID=UPI0018AD182F|nr:glutathione-dependent disulfide-bond oxidoreductase [Sphingobium sp. Cam5-1]QPI72231.1 glutathione-dependent disulfide-bond oxidoreductase [Sphingobium sp. Cam5-1]